VRVRESSSHEELEVVIIRYILVPYDNGETAACLGGLLEQNGFKGRVEALPHILHQHPPTELNRQFDCFHQPWVSCLQHFDRLWLVSPHVLYILIRLVLGVDHQWPSSALVNYNTIFNRSVIFR
jgi:hypothetical protein